MSTITTPITTINSSDTISASRSTINTNFTLRHAKGIRTVVDADSPYTAVLGDDCIVARSTAAVIQVTLPTAASSLHRVFSFVTGLATGGGLEIRGAGSETINGSNLYTCYNLYDSVTVVSDGTGWVVLARKDTGGPTDLSYTASTRLLASSTGADVTLPLFTSTEAGLTPLSGGGTANFLRADGTWAAPAGGAGTDLSYTASTRLLASSTGADVTLPLFTSTEAGLTPLSGGGTTNFLRADGTWAAPSGGGTVTSVGLSAPTGFTVTNSPVTGAGTLTLTYSAGYALPTTSSQTNWDTAYTDRLKWDGGSTGLNATTGRTSLGLGSLATLSSVSTADIGNSQVTYAKIQNVSATDKILGRSTAGAGVVEEITCTSAGRALLDDVDAAAQRTTLGLGTLATQSGTFSGTSSGTNTGDQTITLTGDVTGSGTGSFAATIANSAVTYAKIQNVSATDKLLGRSTAGAGVVEEITCTAAGRALLDDVDASAQRTTLGLGTLATQSGTFSGTSSGTNTGDQTITLTGDVTGSGTGSFSATIANNSVTYAKMQDVSATDRILGRSSAGAGDVEEITCTAAGRNLLDDVDAAAQRTTLGLGTLATLSSVSTADIGNSQVTYAKIQNVSATDRILGRSTAGAGVVEEITCTAAGRNLLDDADNTAQRTTLGLGTIATQASSNVSVTGGTISGVKFTDYTEAKTAPTISSGTLTLNLNDAQVFDVSLNANITTLTISNTDATSNTVNAFTLIFTMDGTARTVTWPGAVKWAGGTAPTLTSTNAKKDVLSFMSPDNGTTWLGFVGGQNY